MAWLIVSLLLALVLFWMVGAHNRMVRLRGEVARQWAVVDVQWLKWLMRFQGAISARQILAWASEAEDLQALQDASDALVEALSDARAQPLDESVLQKVVQQHEALMVCIDRVMLTAPDTVKPHLLSAQNKILQSLPLALAPYHLACGIYNEAISQSPASWLARRLGFRAAANLSFADRTALEMA
jgi:LemA protein